MAVSVAAGTETISTTGTVTITCGFQPKLVLASVDYDSSTDPTNYLEHCISAFDGSNGRIASWSDADVFTACSTRSYQNTKAAYTQSAGGTVTSNADWGAMTASGFTITVNTYTGWRFHWYAIGGTDITDTLVGAHQSGTATGERDITLGFQPDLFIAFGADFPTTTTVDNASSPNGYYLGATDGTNSWCITQYSPDGQNTNPRHDFSTTYAGFSRYSTSVYEFAFSPSSKSSWPADGIRLNWTTKRDATACYISYVAIKGGAHLVGAQTAHTAGTGTVQTTTTGVTPVGLWLAQSRCTALETATNSQNMNIGATDGTNQWMSGSMSVGGGGSNPMGTMTKNVTDAVLYIGNPTANPTGLTDNAVAAISSFSTNAFTLNYSDAAGAAYYGGYWVVGSAAGSATATPRRLALLGTG